MKQSVQKHNQLHKIKYVHTFSMYVHIMYLGIYLNKNHKNNNNNLLK